MARLLEDFLQQFTGGAPAAAADAGEFHDRFVSHHEDDKEFDNQTYHQAVADHLRQLPDDQFNDAAQNAVAQAGPQQRQDLLGGLLNALAGAGGVGALGNMVGGGGGGGGASAIGQIARMLGLGTTDPAQMSGDDAAKLMNYARKENPQILQQAVAEKPWFVKALGNPIVIGALTMAATRLLNSRRR
ncbi:MAG: hypothetical protein ACR2HH_07090 [Chthoniobacterales bacterium]